MRIKLSRAAYGLLFAIALPSQVRGDAPASGTSSDSTRGLETKATDIGMDCEAPDFSFKRLTPRTFILFTMARNPGRFKVDIVALDDSHGLRKDTLIRVDSNVAAIPAPGTPHDVFFESLKPVYSKGGRVRVAYEAVNARGSPDTCVCSERRRGFRLVTVVPEHQIDFNVGRLYNLEKNGNWDASAEFGIHSYSHWTHQTASILDFHFASIGRIDSASDTGAAGGQISNPFLSRAGSLSMDLLLESSPQLEHHPHPIWVYPFFLTAGMGLRTPPGAALDLTTLRPRYVFGWGARIDDYNVGGATLEMPSTSGCLRFLIAYDRFWEWESVSGANTVSYNNYWRLVVEGELEIPGIGGKNLKPALRGFIDAPLHSIPLASDIDFFRPRATPGFARRNSPSKVSLSLLLHVDVEALKTLFSVH